MSRPRGDPSRLRGPKAETAFPCTGWLSLTSRYVSHRVDDSDLWVDAQHEPEENGCSRDRQVFTRLERDGEQVEDASSSSEEEARHGEGCAKPHAAEEAKRSWSHVSGVPRLLRSRGGGDETIALIIGSDSNQKSQQKIARCWPRGPHVRLPRNATCRLEQNGFPEATDNRPGNETLIPPRALEGSEPLVGRSGSRRGSAAPLTSALQLAAERAGRRRRGAPGLRAALGRPREAERPRLGRSCAPRAPATAPRRRPQSQPARIGRKAQIHEEPICCHDAGRCCYAPPAVLLAPALR